MRTDLDLPIYWGTRLTCGHWASGQARTESAIPLPGHPAHCEPCADWFPVVERVDTLPLRDRNGRT